MTKVDLKLKWFFEKLSKSLDHSFVTNRNIFFKILILIVSAFWQTKKLLDSLAPEMRPRIPKFIDLSKLNYPGPAGDDHYYIYAAKFLTKLELLPKDERWIYHLFPPGMSAWYSLLDMLTLRTGNFPLVHAIIMACVWSTLFLIPFLISKNYISTVVTLTLGLLLLNSNPMRSWILGFGLFYSEGFAIAIFILALILLILVMEKIIVLGKTTLGFVGVLIAIAAQTRTIYQFTFEIATLLFLIIIFIAGLRSRLGSKKIPKNFKYSRFKIIKPLVVSYILCTLPLHAITYSQFNSLTFTDGVSRTWSVVWMQSSDLLKEPEGKYYLDAGVNGICESYPVACKEINKNGIDSYNSTDLRSIAIKQIISNPQPFLIDRFSVMKRQLVDHLHAGWISGLSIFLGIFSYFLMLIYRAFINIKFYKEDSKNLYSEIDSLSLYFYSLITITSILTILVLLPSGIEPRYGFVISVPLEILGLTYVSLRLNNMKLKSKKISLKS